MCFSRRQQILSTTFCRWMFAWVIKMLRYGKIDVLQGIDINKSNKSKECIICYFWYFKEIGYKFEPYVWC